MGATPHKGHLLLYNYNGFPLQGTEESPDSSFYPRTIIFSYLLGIGVSVNDVDENTGMTPLLTACEERNLYKIKKLLEHGACMVSKNNQGKDVWFYGNAYKYRNENDTYSYPIRELLEIYQLEFWTEVMDFSLLKDLSKYDVLETLGLKKYVYK